jgi:diguanylate cyclase (GGDEF)-like protein
VTFAHLERAAGASTETGASPTIARRQRSLDNGLDPRVAWSLVAAYSVAIAAVAVGVAGTGVANALVGTSTLALAAGVRLNRPQLSWPFWGFVTAGVFWAVAGAAREATGSTGDLTASRSLVPDAIALPGYAVYGLGLVALIRARDGRNRGALTDAVVVSIAGFLLSWQFLISRTLSDEAVSPLARGAIILYPVLDCAFVAFACRLAFTSANRLPVHGLILLGMCGLLAGDVSYVLDELDLVELGARRDLGYMVAAAAMGAAGLHPSVRSLHLRGTTSRRALPTGRATLLAVSMLLPAGLFIFGFGDQATRALPFQVGVIALAVVATYRLLDSVRNQNLAADALAWQADHDGLTGLPNRDAIMACINDRVAARTSDHVIAYLDLDHFKNINDALGHQFGDQLLMAVARHLRERLPESVVLGRIGGDEFVAICDCGEVSGDELAAHIRSALSQSFVVGGFEASTSASIGITVTSGGRDADAILRDADTAMYRAKDSGRDTWAVFSDDMRVEVERRIRIERELREALERGSEMRAWFQPVHDLVTDEVVGFEALARWVTPTGVVTPDQFIAVAEDTGLITQVGALVLDQACAAIAQARRTSGRDLFVSVNVSARQLVDDSIIEVVADALARHQLAGEALCLEITESIMVNDHNVERLRALCRLGVWLAVDDFGTGYSSLSYLRRMPISKVKIDKSFVDDIAGGDPSIMVAILSMAHSLGLTCIAEGVERPEQAQRLRELGCDSAQGYLWAKPVPVAQLEALLRPPVAVM